jgi:replicative DNA helicase
MAPRDFNFVESSVIFGLLDTENFQKFIHPPSSFSRHRKAYDFLVEYYDDMGEMPNKELMAKTFPELDKAGSKTDFRYAIDQFNEVVLYRDILSTFQDNEEVLDDNPRKALIRIQEQLGDLDIALDDDVQAYNNGKLDRFEQYKSRASKRAMGKGLLGVVTPFDTINSTGLGWQPADLISIFARPTVGKTWMCIKMAQLAVQQGKKTLLVSTEMPQHQMDLRMDVVMGHAMGYNLSHRALRTGDKINEDEYKAYLTEAGSRTLLTCDHIVGQDSITMPAIANLVRKHKPEVLVIDGLYLLGGAGSASWEKNHNLFYGMKNLAMSTNIVVIVSTQATRDAANLNTPPRADQVAFGDALIRASDVAMSMSLLEDQPGRRGVQFQKYRDGDLSMDGTIMNWLVDSGNIEEIEDDF